MKGKSVTNKMFTRGRNRCSFLSFLSFLISSWGWYVLNMVSLKPGLDVIAEMLKKQLSLTLGFRGRIQAGDINVKHAVRYISWGIGMWAEDNLGLDSIQRSGAEASSLKPTTKKASTPDVSWNPSDDNVSGWDYVQCRYSHQKENRNQCSCERLVKHGENEIMAEEGSGVDVKSSTKENWVCSDNTSCGFTLMGRLGRRRKRSR